MKQKQDKTQQKQMPKHMNAQKKANDDTVKIKVATWNELFERVGVFPMWFPYDVEASYVLEKFRNLYQGYAQCETPVQESKDSKAIYEALCDSYLDDVCDAYETRSTFEQLCALGTAMQSCGLRMCYMKRTPIQREGYTIWLHHVENTEKFLSLYKPYITRRNFFNSINTFSMQGNVLLESPETDVNENIVSIPVQTGMPYEKDGSPRCFILDNPYASFLCVPYETEHKNDARTTKELRVFNASRLSEVTAEIEYDRDRLYPYTMTVTDLDGRKHRFVTDDIYRQRSWMCLEDDDECDNRNDESSHVQMPYFYEGCGVLSDCVPLLEGYSPIAKHGDYVYYRIEHTPKSTAIVRYNEKEKTFDVVDIPSLLGVDKSRINCIHDDVNDTTYLFIGIDVNTFEIINLGTDELTYFSSEYLDGIKCDKGGYYVMGENVVMLCMFDGRTLKLKSTKALVDYVLKRNQESNHTFANTGKVQWLHGMRKDASLMEKVEGNKFARLRRKTKDIDGETVEWDFYDDRGSLRGTDTLTIHLNRDA